MKTTIKDIAKKAGVHRSTVDKVIHNRIGVSDDVRKKVQQIIDESGYVPNPAGRILQRQGKTYRLAAVLVDVDAEPYLVQGIQEGVKNLEFNIEVVFYTTKFQNIAEQEKILQKLIDDSIDGIILSPIHSDNIRKMIDCAADAGIPVVTVDSDIPDSKRLCFVGQNAQQASRVAGRLLGLFLNGFGEVAIVTSSIETENNNYYVQKREQGFASFIEDNYPDIRIVERIENLEDPKITYAETLKLIETHPNLHGIYITCGGVAEVGNAIKKAGRQGQIRVVSFEDYPEILQLVDEEVIDCTLGSQLQKQGMHLVSILMDYLVFQKMPDDKYMFTDISIIVKENLYN